MNHSTRLSKAVWPCDCVTMGQWRILLTLRLLLLTSQEDLFPSSEFVAFEWKWPPWQELGVVALLEEVSHWGWLWDFQSPCLVQFHSPPSCMPAAMVPAMRITGWPSGTMKWNAFFPKLPWSWRLLIALEWTLRGLTRVVYWTTDFTQLPGLLDLKCHH